MIYTLTLNPAIDYVMHLESMCAGKVNRAKSEEVYIGGKGINVSLVLHEFGIASKALGFVAGFTGDVIEKGLKEAGIDTDFVHISEGMTRINVKIKADRETEINGCGPTILKEDVEQLFQKLEQIKDGDMLILAGSIPASLSPDIYEKILEHLAGRQIRTVVDAAKSLLLNALKYKPFLVKPNHEELGELFGVQLNTTESIIGYAAKLKEMGAINVLVSRAGDGAVLLDENGETHVCKAYRGCVLNSVGAGDSMLAGFIAGCDAGDYAYALKLGNAAGGATAFSKGLAKKEDIDKLLEEFA